MFFLSQYIQKKVGAIFFARGKSYFQNKQASLDGFVSNGVNGGTFYGIVSGTRKYELTLDLDFIEGRDPKIGFDCSCPAIVDQGVCKHIAAFALEIEKRYKIDADMWSIENREDSTGRSSYTFRNGSHLYDALVTDAMKRNVQSMDMNLTPADIPFLRVIFGEGLSYEIEDEEIIQGMNEMRMGNIELYKATYDQCQSLKAAYQGSTNNDIKPLLSHVNIFTLLSGGDEQKSSIDGVYKMKISIIPPSRSAQFSDLKIGLYICKVLKNGNPSKGKEVFRSRNLPDRFKKIAPFLPERNSGYYYSSSVMEDLSFRTAPDFFLSIITSEEVVYEEKSDALLNIDSGGYRLTAKVETDEAGYRIRPILIGNDGNHIEINGMILISSVDPHMYALYGSRKKKLIFFRTDESISWVQAIFSDTMVLNEKDKRVHEQTLEFEKLIRAVHNPEVLGIQIHKSLPVGVGRIMIPDTFDRVEFSICFEYGTELIAQGSTKNLIKSKDGQWMERNLEHEKQIVEMFGRIITQCETVRSDGIFIKEAGEGIDSFFYAIQEMSSDENIRFEYLQDTRRLTNQSLSVKVQVESRMNWFDTTVTTFLGDEPLPDADKIFKAMRNKQGFVRLDDGTTILLKDTLRQSIDQLEDAGLGLEKNGVMQKIPKYMIGGLRSSGKSGGLSFDLDSGAKKLKKSFENFAGLPELELPKKLNAKLRDYQKIGYDWICFLEKNNFAGILADDMGLGKTVQTIAFLVKQYEVEKIKKPSLIICPTSLVFNWIDEFQKFAPDIHVASVSSSKTGFSIVPPDTQVIIISYGLLGFITDEMAENSFYAVILDEAQNIKNAKTKRSKNLTMLKSDFRLALSGTPIENNLMELWSIFHFLMPGFLGNEHGFKSRYIGAEKEVMQRLSSKIRPFILRRTKEQVMKELPPKIEETIFLDMEVEQARFYESLKIAYRERIFKQVETEGFQKSQFAILEALLRLRQACLTPALISDNQETHPTSSIKLTYLEENIEEIISSGHSVLIFSQFPSFLRFVREILDQKKISYNYLDGGTKNRKELVDSFNAGETKVFLISLKAGGTGLNLVSADYVIHLDPWWNPAVENQATDRAHRMGQTRTVFVQKLIVRGTIEEKVLELQNTKKRLVDDVFSGDWSGKFDETDLRFVFE